MKIVAFGLALSFIAVAEVAAQESPYVGQESREIKALSQEEIEGYLTGKGLGYAKAAELNQYPGPSHVLELAQELSLTEEQKNDSQAIFESMKIEAIELGQQLVDKELELDGQFSSLSVDEQSLEDLLTDINALEASLRFVHLNAHIQQRAVLTTHQINLYDTLRGYGSNTSEHSQMH